MPQRRKQSTTIDGLLAQKIDEAVSRELVRILGGSGTILELKRLPAVLARLERKLESVSGKAPTRRAATAKKGAKRPGRPPIHTTCTRRGCDEDHYAKGLCSKHYQQARRAGTEPAPVRKSARKKATRRKKSTRRR